MTTPAEDIATILETDVVATTGTNMFIGKLIDHSGVPDECVNLVDSGAIEINPKWLRDDLTVQILVRSGVNDYEGGYDLAKAVEASLIGRNTTVVGNKTYLRFLSLGGINWLNTDSQKREIFVQNYAFIVENDGDDNSVRESF